MRYSEPEAAALHTLRIPLPDNVYQALQSEAARAHRPVDALARDVIGLWLEAQQRRHIDQAIVAYAEAVGGTAEDLDPALEAAGLELIELEG